MIIKNSIKFNLILLLALVFLLTNVSFLSLSAEEKTNPLDKLLDKGVKIITEQKLIASKIKPLIKEKNLFIEFNKNSYEFSFDEVGFFKVYDDINEISSGTWKIAGLLQNAINLEFDKTILINNQQKKSIYFQFYPDLKKISSLSNLLDRSNDEQTDRTVKYLDKITAEKNREDKINKIKENKAKKLEEEKRKAEEEAKKLEEELKKLKNEKQFIEDEKKYRSLCERGLFKPELFEVNSEEYKICIQNKGPEKQLEEKKLKSENDPKIKNNSSIIKTKVSTNSTSLKNLKRPNYTKNDTIERIGWCLGYLGKKNQIGLTNRPAHLQYIKDHLEFMDTYIILSEKYKKDPLPDVLIDQDTMVTMLMKKEYSEDEANLLAGGVWGYRFFNNLDSSGMTKSQIDAQIAMQDFACAKI